MHVTVTIKMGPSKPKEVLDKASIGSCRQHFDQLKDEAVFGPPDAVTMRYLVVGDEPQEHGTPEL